MFQGLAKGKGCELQLFNILPWAYFFKDSLWNRASLPSFLWVIQQSQQEKSRSLWYLTCFFFACLPRISERCFHQLLFSRWNYSCLFFLQDQTFFFRLLEGYYNNVDFLQFSPTYFRKHSYKPTTLLLPYRHFHLRAPGTLYLVLWYHSEQIRMRFYNDYVKSHDFINCSSYLVRRFRFQRTLVSYRVRDSRRQLFRYYFYFFSLQQRYRVVEFKGINLSNNTLSAKGNFFILPLLLANNKFRFASFMKKLPMETIADPLQRYFLGVTYIQLNLWANALLADDPLGFGYLVRLDWTYYFISYPLFVMRHKLRRWLYLWSNRLSKKFFSSLFNAQTSCFFLIEALKFSLSPLVTTRLFYFLWWVTDYRINRFWGRKILDRWSRIPVYFNTKTKAKMFPMNYQWYFWMCFLKETLHCKAVFGDFKSISTFFTKRLIPLDFLFWRINSNGESYRRYLANGAFPLPVYFRKLTLDYYAKVRFQNARFLLEYIARKNGFYVTSGFTVHTDREKNPWSLRRPYYRLPLGAYHPKEPRWSFKLQLYVIAIRNFLLSAFRYSFKLSLLSFFCFLDGSGYLGRKKYHSFFREIVITFVAYSRYYLLYRTSSLSYFRRYPHKVFVHSRLDPSFRARWFSFADRMRRAGIKRSNLPYYPEKDDMDIMEDLKAREQNSLWVKSLDSPFWVIDFTR